MFGFFDLANPYFFKTAAELAGLPIHGPGHRPDWPLGLTDCVLPAFGPFSWGEAPKSLVPRDFI